MGNRCIRPFEEHGGGSRTSIDWDDEASIHSVSARNSRHNSSLGKMKPIKSVSANNNIDSIQNARLQGSIRKQSNRSVRQQVLNISFAEEIHQTYLFERDSGCPENDFDIESSAVQTRQPQPPPKKLALSQYSQELGINANPKMPIAT